VVVRASCRFTVTSGPCLEPYSFIAGRRAHPVQQSKGGTSRLQQLSYGTSPVQPDGFSEPRPDLKALVVRGHQEQPGTRLWSSSERLTCTGARPRSPGAIPFVVMTR
jgi:hypothetical protein